MSIPANFCLALIQSYSQSSYKILKDFPYYESLINDSYQKQRCNLDLYFPEVIQNFLTIVLFRGSGLKRGLKAIPKELKEKGLDVVAFNYRLHPKVNAPEYIEDFVAAVARVFKNKDQYGGDTSHIYVCRFSSGGYLSLMVTLDQKWLKEHSY